jgi:hypothetical protein
MYYIDVTLEDLEKLGSSLELLRHLGEDTVPSLFLYGLVNPKTPIMADFTTAVEEYNEVHDVSVDNVVIALELSGDVLHYLLGSGVRLTDEEFAYSSSGEIRTCSIKWSGDQNAMLSLSNLDRYVLSNSDSWMDRFLKLEVPESVDQSAEENKSINRTEEAITPQDEGPEPAQLPHGGVIAPKGSAQKKGADQSQIVKVWADVPVEDGWNEDKKLELIRQIEDEGLLFENFVSWVGGNVTGYIIQIKGGPEAAFRYISAKTDLDYDDVVKDALVLDGEELGDLLLDSMEM